MDIFDLRKELLELHPGLPPTRLFEYSWAIRKMITFRADGSPIITTYHQDETKHLDVGCNGSILDKFLMRYGFKSVCADIDERAQHYWNGEPRTNFVQVDCRHPPEEWYANFDYITIISTLEHLQGPNDIIMIKGLEKCLRTHGRILITVPYGDGMNRQGQWLVRCYNELNIYRLSDPARLLVSSWVISGPDVEATLPIFCVELRRG